MNNQVLETISNRRSNRGFEQTPLTQAQIDALKNAALASPTAMNLQSWHFTFCSDKEIISAVEEEVGRVILASDDEAAKERMKSRDMMVFYNAPTVVFISSDENSPWSALDAGIAVENLALSACSMGLGSVIIGMSKLAFEGEQREKFENMLHFPEGHKFSISIALGVPAVTKEAHPIGENKVTFL